MRFLFWKKTMFLILITTILCMIVACSNSGNYEEHILKRNQDIEFINDSGIRIQHLNEIQNQNLAILAKVWGFVKYRHPDITNGNINWDAELFRVMPKVLDAKTNKEATDIMAEWLEQFPAEVVKLDKIQEEEYQETRNKLYLEYDFSWIKDTNKLGPNLSNYLQKLSDIKVNDTTNGYAVFQTGGTVSVSVDNFMEDCITFEDAGMRLLGLFRYWNVVEYFYPYKNLTNENWDQVLYEKIPELALGKDRDTYIMSMANLTTYIHDSHGFFLDDFEVLRRHFGRYILNVELLNIDNQIVITKAGKETELRKGDIITSINGVSIEDRIEECKKYVSVSNEQRFANTFEEYLLRSENEIAEIEIVRDDKYTTIKSLCGNNFHKIEEKNKNSEKSGLLQKGKVGYINLSILDNSDLDKIMQKFKDTEGLIIDARNGSKSFAVYILAEYLKPKPMNYAQLSQSSMFEPGTFYNAQFLCSGNGAIKGYLEKGMHPIVFSKTFNNGILRSISGKVKERYQYEGKVIILINEYTQSQLETVAMSLGSSPNAVILGGVSAGANGDIIEITLPGGIKTCMSGIAVTSMEGKQLQRLGIVPDILVEPTIKGVIEGRDELLETAIKTIEKGTDN